MKTKKLLTISLILLVSGCLVIGVAFALGARVTDFVDNTGLIHIDSAGFRNWSNEYSPEGAYSLSADNIQSLYVDWIAGDVSITCSEGDEITITERSREAIDEHNALRYGVDDGVLYVQYCKRALNVNLPVKSLTVSLPARLYDDLNAFTLDAASADLSVNGLCARKFVFDSASGSLSAVGIRSEAARVSTASGTLAFEGAFNKITASSSSGDIRITSAQAAPASASSSSGNITLSGVYASVDAETSSGTISLAGVDISGRAELETASGDMSVEGAADKLETDTASGVLNARFTACPSSIDIESSSGDVNLWLPADSNFTLEYDEASGELDIGISVRMQGKKFIAGDGAASISVSTASGDLSVKPLN